MSEEKKKVVPEGIRLLRENGAKPFTVLVGTKEFHFRKDTYAVQEALSKSIKAISDPVGLAPELPKEDADQETLVTWQNEMEEYRAKSNEALVKIAATVMLQKQVDKGGRLLFDGATVEDIEAVLTVSDAQQFMVAYNAFQNNQTKVADAAARFQGG